ncbi:MAG: hypothetical protein AAGB29_10290 [Planctomycetota bacterium]
MRLWRWLNTPPIGGLLAAGAIWLCFGLVTALGWRANVSLLSGTLPAVGDGVFAIATGLLYGFAYLMAIVLAPILAIAALVEAVARWLIPSRRAAASVDPPGGRTSEPLAPASSRG